MHAWYYYFGRKKITYKVEYLLGIFSEHNLALIKEGYLWSSGFSLGPYLYLASPMDSGSCLHAKYN